MIVKTRYNIGDKVWVMFNDEIRASEIDSINVYVENKQKISIRYDLISENEWLNFKEMDLFTTKEELLKSL